MTKLSEYFKKRIKNIRHVADEDSTKLNSLKKILIFNFLASNISGSFIL